MLTVSSHKNNRVVLTGAVEGSEDLNVLIGKVQPGATFDCEGVTQINSTGIKAWMRFFCAPETKDSGFRFERLSIPLVEQLNMFRNFVGNGEVVSLAVPFRCEKCNFNFSQVFAVEDAVQFKNEGAAVACPQCKGPSRFDDLPDEYFEFLDR
jgi:hypothetical protein